MKVSVIIPVYNEEKTIEECLVSLAHQILVPAEIIVIDDGSTDNSIRIVNNFKFQISNFKLLRQSHKGPGIARNLGASKAQGDILVFVDADMTFDKNFLKKLVEPITQGKAQGTFTKDEYVRNWDNPWARSWNINQGNNTRRRIPSDYPDEAPVFRALLRKEFEKTSGFIDIGYTDDWTLCRKLEYKATVAKDAICYHKNPDTLQEVFIQARWIGKNEFLTRTFVRKLYNLLRFSLPVSLLAGIIKSASVGNLFFLTFKITYDLGIFISILGSFAGEQRNK